ncbi:MAG: general stress protein CsbD [Rhodothermales bacterium]|nr:general stress protein CsbD [Rhodothermales bacterium]
MATKRMNESWRRVRDRIRTLWSDADLGTDKEMKKTRGDLRKMVNLVHERTGEPRAEIFRKISAVV